MMQGEASTDRRPAAPPPLDGGHERRDGLDVLRALAAVCTILTHASVAYMLLPPQSMAWPIHDLGPDPSRAPDLMFVWCRAAGVKIFFVLAGFFAAQSSIRSGPAAMLRGRWRRVGVPLLWAMVTVLPIMYLVWCWGWRASGYITWEQAIHLRFSSEDKRRLAGLAHLWYLQYLLIYVCVFFGWQRWRSRSGRESGVSLSAVMLVGGAVMAACVWLDPAMLTDFANSLVPLPLPLLFHAPLFAAGVALARSVRSDRPAARSLWLLSWLGAQAIFLAWALWGAWGERGHGGLQAALTLGLAVFVLVSATSAVALAARWQPSRSAVAIARPMARASYAVYLWHIPVVGAVSVLLSQGRSDALPTLAKLGIAAAAGLCIPLAGYHMYITMKKGGRQAAPFR